ncbi:MAG: hypothetical protein AAGK00_00530 [Pseudomonadota bacterium]
MQYAPNDVCGSKPLADSRHERFAQLLSTGAPLASWADTAPPGLRPSPESAKASGWRVAQRPEVRARVEYLQKLHRPERQSIDRNPVELMREVASVLRETAEAFKHLPMQKRSALKAIYAKHLARLHRMEEPTETQVKEECGFLQNLRACTCPT